MVISSPAGARWRRERALAGDGRAGSYPRTKARRAQYAYACRAWRQLLLAGLGMLLSVAAGAALMPAGFARGLAVGSGCTWVLGWLAFWVVQATGTAPVMMGDQAERWTAGELRKLRRHGYKVVNGMMLKSWDIDHVLLGPGGAYAVETKWSATPWNVRSERVRDAAHRVAGNARSLQLWAELKAIGITDVGPVLVLWGPGTADPATPAVSMVDGVTVVLGPRTGQWTSTLGTQRLTAAQVSEGWLALAAHTDRREERNPVAAPPLSVGQVLARAGVTVVAALLGLLAGLAVVQLPSGVWAAVPVDVVTVAALVVMRPRAPTSWRYPLLGAQVGVGGGLAVILLMLAA